MTLILKTQYHKDLLAHSHTHSLTQYGCFLAITAELSS